MLPSQCHGRNRLRRLRPALVQRMGKTRRPSYVDDASWNRCRWRLLLANAGPEIETRSLSADVVADLGFLLAELADLAAQCDLIATGCRRATADYLPLVLRARVELVDGNSPKSLARFRFSSRRSPLSKFG